MSLKDRIAKAMAHKQCDAPALAAAAKIRTPSVHGWMNGSSQTMKAGPALRAAAFMNVDPLWLAEGEGEMIPHSVSHAVIVQTTQAREPIPPEYLPPRHDRPMVQKICDLAERVNDEGLVKATGYIECLAGEYPLPRAKRA